MKPTSIRAAASGSTPWSQSAGKEAFKSKFGPKFTVPLHVGGVSANRLPRFATLAATFGASAGIFAVFFFSGVPRVQKDILQQVPYLGSFFKHEIAPEDNPF